MTNPSEVVTAYFSGVTAGDAEAVAALFAADAVLVNASGTLRGADSIRKMYENGLSADSKMKPTTGPFIIDGERVAVEIKLDANGSSVTLGDFFTINDGLIQSLSIYSLTLGDSKLFDEVMVEPK